MSRQTTLGEGEGMAAQLAESQRAISIAEFFEKNKQMLGFDSGAKALVTAVKEGVDNSLTWSTPFVYRRDGETIHRPIGAAVDGLIESNRDDVETKRGGDLQKLRVDGMEALSFGDDYDVGFRRVSSVFRHRVNSDIYRITVEGGREVELTDYHSVFVLRDGEVVSVETCEIDEDDYVVLPDAPWDGGDLERIDLVSELRDLPRERTEPIGLHGVEHLIDEHSEAIRRRIDADYRMSDFRKCDRLPFNIVRELDLAPEAYADCEIGYRYGPNDAPAVLQVDEDLAELLGIYAAEGCVAGEEHEKVFLPLGAHETDLIDRVERLVESVFGIPPSTVAAHGSATNVTIPAKVVGLLFEVVFDGGTGAAGKRIPRYVFDFPRELRERFLMGYAAGDGSPTASIIEALGRGGGIGDVDEDRIALSTASDRLSSGLQYLLSSIGYDATHEHVEAETRVIDGRAVEFGGGHELYVHTDQSSVSRARLPAAEAVSSVGDPKLAYNLDGRGERVETDHALALADGGGLEFAGDGRAIAEGDLTALPVTAVERIDYGGGWVYDVSVPGDENFMAGTSPLACHNSLDATEEAGILPDVYVELEDLGDYYRLVVEDNGPGITREEVPKVFGKLLYGSRFHAREQSLLPDQRVFVRRNGRVELVPIGELCDAYIPDPEGDRSVPIGDDIEAPCFDRETGEVRWREVTAAIRHGTRNATCRVETSRGRSIEVTGNHSLFAAGPDGIEEVAAADLSAGDHVVAPETVPTPGDVTAINLLRHVPRGELDDRDWYVYGVDAGTIEEIIERGERVRKPASEGGRERTYHRLNGVEVLRDSLVTNYRPNGYLPAEVVVDLGWEERVADGRIRTYQVGGEPDEVPVTVPLTEEFMRFLGLYVAEGHAEARQVGFTFGSHETDLVAETETTARETVDAGTTTVAREQDSTRVKAFASPLAVFLKHACGQGARNKHVPPFVFRAPSDLQQAFIDALYDGDGTDSHPDNELSYATTSERLARELSYLWTMRGVAASWKTQHDADNISGEETTYRVLVHGEDIETSEACEAGATRTARRLASFGDSDLALLRVEAVERVEPPEYVYDISVPGAGADENFVAGNRGALCVKNSRGQQGIGISAAVLYAQLTSGKPARITSKTDRGEARSFELTIDTDTNEPELDRDEATTWEPPHGTRIELEMEGNMRARRQLHDYIEYTAVVNPHARITFDEPGLDEPMVFERATDELPDETEEIRPHPHGVELGTLQKMLAATDSYSVSGFLQGEFTRVGAKTAAELVDNFRDRHFGRELAWRVPDAPPDGADVETAVADATANKGREATADFAAAVADRLDGWVTHGDVVAAVDRAADEAAAAHGATFGDTVRGNAVAAAWAVVTDDRRADAHWLVDEVTTSRKDDAAIEAVARRIATRIGEAADEADDPRDRVTRETLAEWIAWAAERTAEREGESFGETARTKILDALWERAGTVSDDPPRVRGIEADRDVAAELLEAMRETDVLAPPTGCLAPITAELLEAGLRKEFDADFYATATRDADVHGGDPFIVEAGVAYGGELSEGGNVDVLRFANRVPLVYQLGACATTDVIKQVNWRNYGLDQPGGSGMPGGPAVLAVHVASTNVPFTSESKDAVANVEAIEDEIELALREVGRELKSYRDRQRSLAKRREKRDVIAEVLPRMADKLAEITDNEPLDVEDSLARIMNNVLVERTVADGTVTLAVHNYGDAAVSPEVTDIVGAAPGDPDPDGATVVEMDDEWFVRWQPDVAPGERAEIEYGAPPDADFEVAVDGVAPEKLTVNA